ncbi:hypothetical protein [Leptospira sanjuanensis]|uniref:hypothetical protein n=1 Tax=Leptospira sanjuanensis TaxID=2879643 RepID=UPI001EE870E4|nr:hypothetical protein [Leptospira sanjuanensis]MCG6169999.1 hypothetical protein [Leptospira sanjuanensis]
MKLNQATFLPILILSVFCNLLFVYQNLSQTRNVATPIPETADCNPQKKDFRESVSTAEILPHPPDFLEGKKIRFFSYTTRKAEGKRWILFQEKIGNRKKETKVDAEAVRWF